MSYTDHMLFKIGWTFGVYYTQCNDMKLIIEMALTIRISLMILQKKKEKIWSIMCQLLMLMSGVSGLSVTLIQGAMYTYVGSKCMCPV